MNVKKLQEIRNVDDKEITKFEALTALWWNCKGKLRTLHQINPIRLGYILERSEGLFGKNVLDVGCGGGLLSEGMAFEGAIVTGLDTSLQTLEVARMHAIECGLVIDYLQETAEEHAKTHPKHYDVVTCMEMLEHVPRPQSVVNACAKLVKPGGQVFFSTINRNCRAWLITIVLAEYILQMLPKGTHNPRKFIKPAELLSWLDQTCLQEQDIVGLRYNPILDRFRLCSSIGVNYILHTTENTNNLTCIP